LTVATQICVAARAALTAALIAAPAGASAHGINGHVHVTGWAIESLPPGPLRDFFGEAALRDTAQIGAAFPDSGYAVSDPYGEMAHWEPFIEAYVQWIKATYGGDYASDDARHHIAFMMGAASHGLQDEIFDTIFLPRLQQEDGQGQEAADPGTDAFLFMDGWLRFKPAVWYQADDLRAIFLAAHDYEPEADQIRLGMQRVKTLVIDNFAAIAPTFDMQYRPLMPWGSMHYMDPEIAGGHASEIPATAAYIEALWARLHDGLPTRAAATYTLPGNGRPIPGLAAARVESWIHVVFGVGTRVGSLTPETVSLWRVVEESREPVPVEVRHTRWSSAPDDTTRLLALRPQVDLVPGGQYVVRVEAGLWLQDGRMTDAPIELVLTAACPEPAAGCEPVTHEGPWDPPLVEWDAAAPDAAATPQDAAPAPQDAAPAPQDAAPAPGDVSINPLAPPEPSGCAARPAASTGFGALAAALFGAVVVRRSRRRD
jgi:hypothetical protein